MHKIDLQVEVKTCQLVQSQNFNIKITAKAILIKGCFVFHRFSRESGSVGWAKERTKLNKRQNEIFCYCIAIINTLQKKAYRQ